MHSPITSLRRKQQAVLKIQKVGLYADSQERKGRSIIGKRVYRESKRTETVEIYERKREQLEVELEAKVGLSLGETLGSY